jgi:hypothetical protein
MTFGDAPALVVRDRFTNGLVFAPAVLARVSSQQIDHR